MRKKNHRGLCAVLLLAFLFAALPAGAPAGADGPGYGVTPVFPENQLGGDVGYFDLLMEPGGEQTLEVQIQNYGEEALVINAEVATAKTLPGGTADYKVREGSEADSTLLYRMEELAALETGRVEVPAYETVVLPLHVTMPQESFDGVLAGGLSFKAESTDAETATETSDGGVTVKNEFSYVVALLLRQNENEVAPDLVLNDVGASQFDYKNVISANLQNIMPAYINNMRAEARVREKGQTEALYAKNMQQMQMVPNSNFNYYISLDGQRFQAGDYVFTISLESDQGSWSFEREFTITNQEARQYNALDVNIESDDLWIYVAIGAGILLLILLIVLIVRKRRKNRMES